MKSFLDRERAASVAPLRVPGGPVVPAMAKFARAALSTPECAPSPHVEVVKEGDRVVRLVVTCACGERVEIDCLYASGG